jgi:hypothetical protein
MSSEGAPSARLTHNSIISSDIIFILGGHNGRESISGGGIYNITTDIWKPFNFPPFMMPRIHLGAAAGTVDSHEVIFYWGGALFEPGGSDIRGDSFNDGAIYDISANEWQELGDKAHAPSKRSGHIISFCAGRFVVFGGSHFGTMLSDGGIYDPVIQKWTALASSETSGPPARENPSFFCDEQNRHLLIYGGFSSSPLSDLWQLDLSADLSDARYPLWQEIEIQNRALPSYRPMVYMDSTQILIYGGYRENPVYELTKISYISPSGATAGNLWRDDGLDPLRYHPAPSISDIKNLISFGEFYFVLGYNSSVGASISYINLGEKENTDYKDSKSELSWYPLALPPDISANWIGYTHQVFKDKIIMWGARDNGLIPNSNGIIISRVSSL